MKLVLFYCDEIPAQASRLIQAAAQLVKNERSDLINAVLEQNQTTYRCIGGLIPLLSSVEACSQIMRQEAMETVLFDPKGTLLVLADHGQCEIRGNMLNAQPLEICLNDMSGVLGRATVNLQAWFDINTIGRPDIGKLVIIQAAFVNDDDGDLIMTTNQKAKSACRRQISGEIPTQLA